MTNGTSRLKLGIPFLSTKIMTDIILFFTLLPIWIALGIVQFFGPILMIFLFIKLLIKSAKNNTPIKIPFLISTLMGLFLLSSLISSLMIQESYWRLVFIRTFIVYVAAFALLLVIINIIKNKQHLKTALWALSIMAFIAGIIGVFGLLNIIPDKMSFATPITKLLPESIRSSEFLSEILYPSISGYHQQFFGIRVKRISSLFLFPNYFAAAIIIIFPFQVFLFNTTQGIKKLFVLLNSVLLLICLIFTYSRSAILGLFIGFIYFVYLQRRKKERQKNQKLSHLAITVIVLVLVFLILTIISTMTQIKPMSIQARTTILKYTLHSWSESPIFGWGTQRNMEVVGESSSLPPLGSHSTFLSLLYRYGLSGFILFLGILIFLFLELKGSFYDSPIDSFWLDFNTVCGWVFFANLVQAFLTVMDYDVVILFLIWMNWGFILVARRMLSKGDSAS
jgi:O-antigen ligase